MPGFIALKLCPNLIFISGTCLSLAAQGARCCEEALCGCMFSVFHHFLAHLVIRSSDPPAAGSHDKYVGASEETRWVGLPGCQCGREPGVESYRLAFTFRLRAP
jgi:hypothetical protein